MSKKGYTVYKHTSPSGKVYIGITSQKPSRRWNNGNGYENNKYFKNSIQKYGWDNFKHEILFTNMPKEDAKLMEQLYIALYDSTNRTKGYNRDLGGNLPSIETIEKIRKSQTGKKMSKESKLKMSKARKGRVPWNKDKTGVFSEDTLKKISEALKGENNPNYGKHHTEDARRKISIAHKGKRTGTENPNAKKVICITTGKIFNCINDAAKYYNIKSPSNITACCSETYKSCNGLIWMYYEDYLKDIDRIDDSDYKLKWKQNTKPMLGKKHTELSKMKIRDSRKGIYCGENHPWYGRKHTEKSKLKNRNSQLRENGNKAKKIICLNNLEIFNCIKSVEDKYGIDPSGISKVCRGKRNSCGRINNEPAKWMFYEDYLKESNDNEK